MRSVLRVFSILLLMAPAWADCGGSTVADYSPELVKKAEAFLADLKAAVQAKQKDRVAAMVQFPLMANSAKGRQRIRTKAQFVAGYDRLMTRGIEFAIAKQAPECLFANAQGVMIGNGEVWFDEQPGGGMKIRTLNIP